MCSWSSCPNLLLFKCNVELIICIFFLCSHSHAILTKYWLSSRWHGATGSHHGGSFGPVSHHNWLLNISPVERKCEYKKYMWGQFLILEHCGIQTIKSRLYSLKIVLICKIFESFSLVSVFSWRETKKRIQ